MGSNPLPSWNSINLDNIALLYGTYGEYDADIYDDSEAQPGWGWLTPTVYEHAIVELPDGGFVTAWRYYSTTGSAEYTYVTGNLRIFDADGDVVQNIVLDGDQAIDGLFVFPSGEIALLWHDASLAYSLQVPQLSLVDTEDGTLGPTLTLSSEDGVYSLQGDITADGSLVLSWLSASSYDWNVATVSLEDFENAVIEDEVTPLDAGEDIHGSVSETDVAVLKNGNFVLAWADGSRDYDTECYVMFKIITPDGTEVVAPTSLISALEEVQIVPTIHLFENGDFGIFYQSDKPGNGYSDDIFFQRFTQDGTLVQAETFVGDVYSTIDGYGVIHVENLADGGFVVAYEPNYYAVAYELRRFDAEGNLIDSGYVEPGNANYNRYDEIYDIIANEHGGFSVVWASSGRVDTDYASEMLIYTFDNQYFGTSQDESFEATKETHWFHGQGGDDSFDGSKWRDIFYGGSGSDTLSGAGGRDLLVGGSGKDVLDGGTGIDKMKGQGGSDRYYVDNTDDVVIEGLNKGKDTVFASVSFTLPDNVENLVLTGTDAIDGTGNDLDNKITGNTAANVLKGAAGDDVIKGGDGDDTIEGGAGADETTGGKGTDIFVFKAIGDSTVAATGRDTIVNFKTGHGDLIDLSAIDADTDTDGDQAFTFVGSDAFSATAGELRIETGSGETLIYGDIDGDGIADFAIRLDSALSLGVDSFVL